MNLLIALFACSNSEKNDIREDTAFTACSATIESTYPILNAADVYYRDSLKVHFSEEGIDATLTLTDSSGAEISGTGTVEGTTRGVINDAKTIHHYSTCIFTKKQCGDLDLIK